MVIMGGASQASGLEDRSTGRSYEVMMVSMEMSMHLTHMVMVRGGFGPDHSVPDSTPRPLTGAKTLTFLVTDLVTDLLTY